MWAMLKSAALWFFLKRQVKFGRVALQDDEADGIAVFEDRFETEQIHVERLGAFDILHRQGRGDAAKPDRNFICISHGKAPVAGTSLPTLTVQQSRMRPGGKDWRDGARRGDLIPIPIEEKRRGAGLGRSG